MKRKSSSTWHGTGKEGKGTLTTQSKVLNQTPYSYFDRFGEGKGTNPDELIAAAHAGCFNLKLSFILGAAGFTPDKLETNCEITIEDGTINSSHLSLTGTVPGITAEKFEECANEAKANCPVSKLLRANITLDINLA